MTRTYVEEGDGVSHAAEPAVDSSETFEEFNTREFPAIVALAYALSGSRTASEDLAHEALLAAHGDWDRVGAFERPDVWVRRVVTNLSRSMGLRRRYAEAKALPRIALEPRPRCPNWMPTTPSSGRPSGPFRDEPPVQALAPSGSA